MVKKITLLSLLFLFNLCGQVLGITPDVAMTAQTMVRVATLDSLEYQPLPYTAVIIEGTGGGVLTNEYGIANIKLPKGYNKLTVQTMGYSPKTVTVGKGETSINVYLVPSGVKLKEVTVGRTKEKYPKKNNPAVKFVESIMGAQELTNPRRHNHYNFNKYERMTIAINNFKMGEGGMLNSKFGFLKEHVDTSEVSGKPILNFSVREKAAEVCYRREPRSEKEYVTGLRHEGIDDIINNQENMQTALEDVFREVDLYENDINILQNRFVSPLSRIATDFYKFYLTDTLEVEGERCVVLGFVPHNNQTFGFVGRVYVPENDSTMFIKKVEMNVSRSINLNFIERLYINQEFVRAADGTRLKVKDDMIVEAQILPGTPGIYFRRNTAYNNHNFRPAEHPEIFDHAERIVKARGVDDREADFWQEKRQVAMSGKEQRIGEMVTEMRKVPLYYWTERTLKLFASGYVPLFDGKVKLGQITEFISGSSTEGVRLQLGGLTTANLSKRLFARGYAAYGFNDEKFKYSGELEYSFIDKKYHSREFPVQSIKLRHSYDVDEIGQGSAYYSNMDMLFSSFTRMKNNQMTYRRQSELEYVLEMRNNFSLTAGLRYARQEATPLMTFTTGDGGSYWKYDQATFDLQLRYAPGEKFYQGSSDRLPINKDAPVFTLKHTFGPMNFLGSMWTINKTEASVMKRVWFSAFGYADFVVKGGHVWNQAPYPDLLIPTSNISYLIQPETFALLNPLEFVLDSYASWDITYWANGAIFNYIPLLKRLKLREVFAFRGFVGDLSKKNDPQYNSNLFRFPEVSRTQRLGSTPYMEVAVGLDNFLKIFRVDYVWRLTYRNAPGIDTSGLRATLHITF